MECVLRVKRPPAIYQGSRSPERIARSCSHTTALGSMSCTLIDALVATLRDEAPGAVLTGAADRGIGIPALIRAARDAARSVV